MHEIAWLWLLPPPSTDPSEVISIRMKLAHTTRCWPMIKKNSTVFTSRRRDLKSFRWIRSVAPFCEEKEKKPKRQTSESISQSNTRCTSKVQSWRQTMLATVLSFFLSLHIRFHSIKAITYDDCRTASLSAFWASLALNSRSRIHRSRTRTVSTQCVLGPHLDIMEIFSISKQWTMVDLTSANRIETINYDNCSRGCEQTDWRTKKSMSQRLKLSSVGRRTNSFHYVNFVNRDFQLT